MKNLKKVLALGLALVMILGMFTIASAAETKKVATDLTDWASVENKDAVSLMVDLGVISGMPDGTYSPANNIDRASWAKMVFFVLTGETDAKVYESDYPALKDIDKNWAQGYIEYLYSIECVSGDTDGNYNPGSPISVVAAAKTMLTGLGYNSKIEGYENDANWATNIMTRAKSVGLLSGISLKQNDNITRDAAAQMVYNALEAQTVTAKYTLNFMTGERVPSGEYDKGETLAYKAFSIVKVEATITGVNGDGNAVYTGNVANATSTIPANGKKIAATAANVGTKASFYVKASGVEFNDKGKITKATVGDLVSSRLAGDASGVLKTITDGVKFNTESAKVWDSKDKAYVGYDKDDTTVKYYVNGEDKNTTAVDVASGDKAELVDTDNDGDVDIVRITTYTVYTVKEDPTSKTKDDKTTVTVKLAGTSDKTVQADAGIVEGYQDLAKDDVVLYTETKTTNGSATVAHTFEKVEKALTGKVASYKGTTLRVSGKDYDVSGVEYGVSNALGTIAKGKNEYDFYLGKDGKICYAAVVGEEASKDLVLVMDVTEDNTGSGFDKGSKISAKVLFTDGTTDVVTLASVKFDGTTETKGSAIIGSDNFLEGNTGDANILKGFFTYKVNKDGNYVLTADSDNLRTLTSVALDGTNAIASGVTGDSATVYIVELIDRTDEDAEATYTVYTGYKNAPKIDTDKVNTAVAYGGSGKAVKYAFISASALKGSESKEMFFVPDHTDIYTDNVNECQVLVAYNDKGDKVEIKISNEASAITKDGFYKVSSVSDDVYTLDTAAIEITSAKTAVLGGGVLTINGQFVTFDDATEMRTITLDEDGAVSSYTTGKVDGSFEDGTEEGDPTYVAILGDGTVPSATVTDAVDVVYVIVTPKAA